MADHSKPTNTSLYTDYTSEIDARFDDLTLGLDPAVTSPTNVPTNAIRWNSASAKWEKWNGAAWVNLASAYNINLAGPITLTANSASDAFKITQTGTGNAFVVEDSTSPDATPFVINADGKVLVGDTTSRIAISASTLEMSSTGNFSTGGAPAIALINYSTNAAFTSGFSAYRAAGGVIGTPSAVSDGWDLGSFNAFGYDGTNYIQSSRILAEVDGTSGTGSMPGRLVFSTTPSGSASPVERMRITNNGAMLLGVISTSSHWLRISKNGSPANATEAIGFFSEVAADVNATVAVQGFRTSLGVLSGATTANSMHYYAVQGAVSGTLTNQYGFNVFSNLTGATNNYGFYSNIAAATGRWNFYANGTAQNYFAGQALFNNTSNVTHGAINLSQLQVSTNGATTAGLNITSWATAGGAFPRLTFGRSQSGTINTAALVINGTGLMDIAAHGNDGTNFIQAASITASVDGTPGTNDMPGRLVFSTTSDGASFPTERTRISSNGTLQHRFDLAVNNATVLTASYDSVSFSVAGQETDPQGVTFRPDGLRMYIPGNAGNDITQYTLTTAWDITTSGSPVTFSINTQEATIQDMYFKPDGTAFYIVGITNDTVYQYTCSTAWDITTASYASKSFSVASQEANPSGLFFKPDGLKMYVIGVSADSILEYDLGTAWDVSTAVYNSISFSIAAQETNPQALLFTNDGYKLFVMGAAGDDINEYSLSRSWDITTATFLGVFSVASQETVPYGIYIKPDLSKFYIIGGTNDTVYQYSMGAGAINLTSDVQVNGKFSVNGTPPAAATSSGKKGDIIWDSGYIYICVEDNTWKRSAISTW
jgi:hypothetical protein